MRVREVGGWGDPTDTTFQDVAPAGMARMASAAPVGVSLRGG